MRQTARMEVKISEGGGIGQALNFCPTFYLFLIVIDGKVALALNGSRGLLEKVKPPGPFLLFIPI